MSFIKQYFFVGILLLSCCTNVQLTAGSSGIQKTIIFGAVLTAAVAYVFGQDLYECYIDHFYSDEQIVERSSGKCDIVLQSTQNMEDIREIALKYSDDDLKKYIRAQYSGVYSFRSYHEQIVALLSGAQSNMTVLENELRRLNGRYAVLLSIDRSNECAQLKNDYLLNAYTHMISRCKDLCDIVRGMMEDLKTFECRIASFEEYHKECERYENEQDDEWDRDERSACKRSRQRKLNRYRADVTSDNDVFERTEKSIMQFNLDYY
jgi:hypothetical protein